MESIEALKTRRSIRRFLSNPVQDDLIEQILDVGRLAPTARNVQPWHFIVVKDEHKRKTLSDITDYGKFIADAPVCIVVISEDTKYYLEDGCAATTNILNAAHSLGLGSCWVAGDKKQYSKEILSLLGAPADFKLICLIALGYPAGPGKCEKKKLSEVVHWEKF